MKISSFMQAAEGIQDPRRLYYGNIRHKLIDMLVIGLITFLCGGKDPKDMEELGNAKHEWLKGFLELPFGIPDNETFRRLYRRINPDELSKCLNQWIMQERDYQSSKQISIDGKTIKGSGSGSHRPYHVVSAWACEHGITLGQVTVDEKSNEITAIPQLLNLLDIENSVVTIDAMGCQRDIAKQIVDAGADYCLSLKGNQKNLYNASIALFESMDEGDNNNCADYYEDNTCNGARIEKRQVSVICVNHLPNYEEFNEKFKALKSIVRIVHTSIANGRETLCVRYFITSLAPNARRLAYVIRSHWSIEGVLHWALDVVFDEDRAKTQKDNSPLNFNIIRKTALSLLIPKKQGRTSFQKMMFRAAMQNEFLDMVLFGF